MWEIFAKAKTSLESHTDCKHTIYLNFKQKQYTFFPGNPPWNEDRQRTYLTDMTHALLMGIQKDFCH